MRNLSPRSLWFVSIPRVYASIELLDSCVSSLWRGSRLRRRVGVGVRKLPGDRDARLNNCSPIAPNLPGVLKSKSSEFDSDVPALSTLSDLACLSSSGSTKLRLVLG